MTLFSQHRHLMKSRHSLTGRFLYCIAVVAVLCASALQTRAYDFDNESLSYKVKYKWGLINKQAGHATLTLRRSGPHYVTKLTAASEPWADHIYMVRDTLNGLIVRDGFRPVFYEKIAHEGGEHKHDTVTFGYDGSSTVTGRCTRRVIDKKGRLETDQKLELQAEGTTVDMLSSFYFMRRLPFENWQPGHSLSVNIFSGKRKELLTIRYHGIAKAKSDKREYDCYHITFIFTSNGRKKTSDDMDAWISTDENRIPIRLEGKLPIGKVHCILSSD